MSVRTRIVLVVLWVASLVGVGAWAQLPSPSEHKVISGDDLGFRVERVDRAGTPIGRLVVRIDGHWVEAGFAVGVAKVTK